jgi:ParB family transcriptional regulator, chromosome partitioning protein
MTRKPLGRGLGALLSADKTSEATDSTEIDPSLIEPCSAQPRMRFDDASLNELADSIRENGVVQPLLVRRKGSRFELIAGERRLRAAKIAGLETVPVLIREVPDEKLLEIALVENIQREDLNPIEEAHAYKGLLEGVGLTQESLASRVGRDRSYITNYLRLLRLPDDVQNLVQDKVLSTGHARALLGIPDPSRQSELAATIVKRALSVRETEDLIRRSAGRTVRPRASRVAGGQVDPNARALETKLRRELGTQVKVVQKQGQTEGIVEIEFYSLADLDRITRRLLGSNVQSTSGGL